MLQAAYSVYDPVLFEILEVDPREFAVRARTLRVAVRCLAQRLIDAWGAAATISAVRSK